MLRCGNVFFILVISCCSMLLNAAVYDNDLLNTYSKLSPRFILMSTQRSTITESINICLVSEVEDENFVNNFIEFSDENYPDGIKNYPIKFIKTTYNDIAPCSNSQLLFLFNTNTISLNKAISFAFHEKIITISYNDKFLAEGVDISLFLGRDIKPYLNLESIFNKGIHLENILLRVSKIYKVNNKDMK